MILLDDILKNKIQELQNFSSNGEGFKNTFAKKDARIIGELKLASPNYDFSQTLDYKNILDFYGKQSDIYGVSILIDTKYFQGDISRIVYFKEKYQKPVLFKEFVIDERQIEGAHYFGYDAILLIKRVLSKEKIIQFTLSAFAKNIFPIIEVDNIADLAEVLNYSEIKDFGIGINCRDLGTMALDINNHFLIYDAFEEVLKDKIIFAFSGIKSNQNLDAYKNKFNGVLIGSDFIHSFSTKK